MGSVDDILERLAAHLRPLGPPDITIDRDTDLVDALGLDSVAVINLVLDLEDEFDVAVPINQLADVRTAGDLAGLIERLGERG